MPIDPLNPILTPLQIDQKITTTTNTTIQLTCRQILEMVKERITDNSIPNDNTVDVEIHVATSYDGSDYEFDHEPIITISYSKTTLL